MNCKYVEPLLSLYVGRDLEEEHSRLVAAHLQSCKECTLAADEYAAAGQLLHGYEPPFFSDEIYGSIREQVLNEIKRKPRAVVSPGHFSQLFLALVQPRMRWVTAALLLAIAVTALYLSRKPSRQQPNDEQVAVRTGEPNQAGSGSDARSKTTDHSAASTSSSNDGPVLVASPPRQTSGKREANGGLVAANPLRKTDTKPDSSTNDREAQGALGLSQSTSAPAPLRVEMQTNDRNIRIIWLSGQRPDAGGTQNSKGT
jgi:putative zinc finger protein